MARAKRSAFDRESGHRLRTPTTKHRHRSPESAGAWPEITMALGPRSPEAIQMDEEL